MCHHTRCIGCDEPIARHDGPGRPPLRCWDCANDLRNAQRRQRYARGGQENHAIGLEIIGREAVTDGGQAASA